MGCILSEAVTWIMLGSKGIKQFRRLRSRAHVMSPTRSSSIIGGLTPSSLVGHMFHDGEKVSRLVILWHQHLRGIMQVCDTVTIRILDIVDMSLLVDMKSRISAQELLKRMDHAIGEPEHDDDVTLGAYDELESLLEEDQSENSDTEEFIVIDIE
ncbi:hypothetical protein EJ05DRAFT_488113 [Pseudovirgaria hyperparasitica]|uniref:Uncharacterized protein n=1 Tax=Pseudovirgaria hyperparasitica TaxID=470096 RepID=A0A6A6VXD1_9PEZI|nr:uncharacterized protein EJ05DRAFT_488113 [Pseudovirgaria hyperparasitica]KAF2755328.1 hypothetical protein EJ05DRAFT_488113 [Pseudovirgaria hyperparasitica]